MIRYLAIALFSTLALAGTNNLPIETGRVIQRQHVNKFHTAFSLDVVPRDANGNVTDIAGSLGSSTYRWNILTAKKLNLIESAAGNAISLVSPAALASGYTFTFPSVLPSVTQPLYISSSGVVATTGIAAPQISSSSGAFSQTNVLTFTQVTNLSVAITTHGRPVILVVQPDGSTNDFFISTANNATLAMFRDSTQINSIKFLYDAGGGYGSGATIYYVDSPAAGTYTYTVRVKNNNNSSLAVSYAKLLAYEIN